MKKCGINRILVLLLVSLLAFGQMPFMTFAACDAIGDSVMQEQDDILPDENDTNTTDGADGEDKNSELPGNEADDAGEMKATGEINSKDDLPLTCSGSISGMLWQDENSDGTWDTAESGISNYPVSLYKADDRSNAVQTVTTDIGGKYAFANIESGIYVVGVKSNELGADYYMLPMEGVTGDNKFGTWSSDGNEKYSDFITMEMNTTVTDINAGLRMPPVAQATSAIATVIGTEVTLDGLAAGELQMEIKGILMDNSYPAITTPDDITKLTVIGVMNKADLNYIWRGAYDICMSRGKMNGITTLDLSGVTLEEMTGFPDYQFAYNTVLQTVTLPTGLSYLGDYTFGFCTSLTNVDLSGCTGMSYVGEGTFSECTGLTSIGTSGMVDVLLPTGLSYLGDYIFADCESLTSVDLSGCTSMTNLGEGAFSDCLELTNVDLSGCIGMIYVGDFVFNFCTSLTSIGTSGKVDVLLPTGLSYLGDYIFVDCESLTSVDLSGCTSMTHLGDGAFGFCTSLTGIGTSGTVDMLLPTGLDYLGAYAFYECESLMSVDLSDCTSMTGLRKGTFEACKSLTSVDLSDCTSMLYVGEETFTDCKNLTSVILSGIPRVVAISGSGSCDTFEGTNGVKVIVPYTLLTSYQKDSNWSHNVSAYNVNLLADQNKPEDSTGNDKINKIDNNKNHNSGALVGTGKQATLTANKDIKTGDSSNLWLWVVLTITGLGVLVVMGCRKRGFFGRKENKRFLC